MLKNERQLFKYNLTFCLCKKAWALFALAISIPVLAICKSNYSEISFFSMIWWCWSCIWIFSTWQVRFQREPLFLINWAMAFYKFNINIYYNNIRNIDFLTFLTKIDVIKTYFIFMFINKQNIFFAITHID